MKLHQTIRRAGALCLLLAIAASVCLPLVQAAETKTVRVGWYDSSYNTMDENGHRYGYAYDYQQKIASYTGWTYEYVRGGWSELLGAIE